MQEADKRKPFKYDVDGYDIITNAINDLLNQYPGLLEGEQIKFSTLGEESGIAFYPVTGAAISSEKVSVTGKVNQLCNYPFCVPDSDGIGEFKNRYKRIFGQPGTVAGKTDNKDRQ